MSDWGQTDVNEDELHALVDRQLPEARREAVQRALAADPDAARRVALWRSQRDRLRDALADPAGAPPASSLVERAAAKAIAAQHRRHRWRMAASVALAVTAGTAAGAYWPRPAPPSRSAMAATVLAQQAVANFAVFGPERAPPVDISAADLPHLRSYFSQALHRPVDPPSLDAAGFRLLGGRLVATERGDPAALLLYENEAHDRLGLLLRPMAPDLNAAPFPVRRPAPADLAGRAWIGGGMGYAIVGHPSIAGLENAIEAVRSAPGAG